MTNNITMIVSLDQQRRLINLKIDETLDNIEKSIINVYSLKQKNYFHQYQIQYYDPIYKTFIDLYIETIERFHQLLQELLLPNAPSKDTNHWYLKIIPKATRMIHSIMKKNFTSFFFLHVDDTFHDSTVVCEPANCIEQESRNMQMDDTTSSSQSTKMNDLHEDIISQIGNDNHPLNFHFEENIDNRQRKQYESEVEPKIKSKNSIGGVLLRASKLDSTNPYPILKVIHIIIQIIQSLKTDDNPFLTTVLFDLSNKKNFNCFFFRLQFQIPIDKLKSSWSVYFYILTECDANGNYYLHASKGIYDNKTMITNRFGPIPNSNLVNPYKISLTDDDIQQGKYE